MKKLGPFGNGHSDYDELVQDDEAYVSDDLDWCEPISKSVDLLDDDDGLGEDVPSFRHTPYCPIDALDALELCGRLLDGLANGKPVSPDKAVMAAGQAVKCFARYNYEQQEWFIDALCAATEREANGVGTDDTPRDSTADEGLGDKRERKSTT